MRPLLVSMTLLAAVTLTAQSQTPAKGAGLSEIRTVYVLPMSSGMDQFLASRLTREGVFQVVADPAKADAVLTEYLGAAFEQKLSDLYPAPKPEPPKPAPTAEADAPSKDADAKDDAAKGDDKSGADMGVRTIDVSRVAAAPRGRGTLFLVKRDTREVLWSAYHQPAMRRGKEQEAVASKLVATLKHAVTNASKPAASPEPTGK